jgi:predicted methyltransferase
MNTSIRSLGLLAGLALGAGVSSVSIADVAPGFNAALQSDARAADEKQRDAARKPADVMSFVGIDAGMTILEVSAGAGWYTEVLSAAVGPNGTIVAQNSPRFEDRVGDAFRARAARLGNVDVHFAEIGDLGLSNEVDAAFTALNLHDSANRGDEGGMAFLSGIYAALAPGGVLGFIDHVGVDGQDNAALHRIEKARAMEMLTRAGFEIEAQSDILMNSADDHTLNIRDESLGRATDRMLIRARKPR